MIKPLNATRGVILTLIVMTSIAALAAQAGGPNRVYDPENTFPGIDHYWRIDTTASTAGSLRAPDEAIAELKRRGFKSVINLAGGRTAEAEGKAVEAAGLKYFLIPLAIDTPTLDPAPIDPFLKVASDPANAPMLIHSGLGHRPAAFWMIKRVLVDKWTVEKAGQEATKIGLVNNHPMVPRLWQLALDYLRDHGIEGLMK